MHVRAKAQRLVWRGSAKQRIWKCIRTRVTLKLQYFDHLMQRVYSLMEKTLMLGETEGRRRSGRQKMRWLDSITNSMDMF